MADTDLSKPERRIVGRPFPKGQSGNPGGKPRWAREIQQMLDDEHRTVENMRQVFARLRVLAMGETIEVVHGDGMVTVKLKAVPDFMRLYLERVIGPVEAIKVDLKDAPEEVVSWLAENVQ